MNVINKFVLFELFTKLDILLTIVSVIDGVGALTWATGVTVAGKIVSLGGGIEEGSDVDFVSVFDIGSTTGTDDGVGVELVFIKVELSVTGFCCCVVVRGGGEVVIEGGDADEGDIGDNFIEEDILYIKCIYKIYIYNLLVSLKTKIINNLRKE